MQAFKLLPCALNLALSIRFCTFSSLTIFGDIILVKALIFFKGTTKIFDILGVQILESVYINGVATDLPSYLGTLQCI